MVLKNIALKMFARGLLGKAPSYATIGKDADKNYPTLYASMGNNKAAQIERGLGVRAPHRYERPAAVKQGVPNVIGLDIREAIRLLENAGLTVNFTGTGMVAGQSLAAGSNFTRGQRITLRLRNH